MALIINLLKILRGGNAEDVFLQWRRQFGPMYTFWMDQISVERTFMEDFGLGKNLMQDRIMLELGAMFAKIDAKSGSIDEVNLPELIDVAVGSIINNLMFGYRFEGDKEREFWDIKRSLDEHVRSFGNPLTMIWLCYPHLLGHVPPFSAVADQIKRRLDKFFGFFESRITEHQQELDKCGDWEAPPKDFVEAFLKEMKRKNERIKMGTISKPRRFKPERFLEQNGANKSLARCDELIPFSVGKRQCLGESMARMELFLFIANIFNSSILPKASSEKGNRAEI
uniref:Cytochrome P450 n=1 Tax=Globodera pallida TaxID=36090 RepID=A0A183C9Z4_GLOPA